MEYRGWIIEKNSYGFTKRFDSDGYKAFNMNDCDASMIYASTVEEVKELIDLK